MVLVGLLVWWWWPVPEPRQADRDLHVTVLDPLADAGLKVSAVDRRAVSACGADGQSTGWVALLRVRITVFGSADRVADALTSTLAVVKPRDGGFLLQQHRTEPLGWEGSVAVHDAHGSVVELLRPLRRDHERPSRSWQVVCE